MVERTFVAALAAKVKETTGRVARESEKRAWVNSLSDLSRSLMDAERGRLEVFLEFPMPGNKRSSADVVLAGYDSAGRVAYVVVELKQWSEAALFEGNDALVDVPGMRPHQSHPAVQVKGYRDQLRRTCSALDGRPEAVSAVVYLQNARRDDIRDLYQKSVTEEVPLFCRSERGAFVEYLQRRFSDEPGQSAGDILDNGAMVPTGELLDRAADVLRGRDQFVLLDEQQEALQLVRHDIRTAFEANTKRVVIITGGPGSGKTAIALSLLREFAEARDRVAYVTGSRTLTRTFRRAIGGRDKDIAGLFQYYNDYANAPRNRLDMIIVDEAHRVRAKSQDRFNAARRSDRPQIESLMEAARVPVFLLDEHQVVKPGEVGTVAAIEAQAQALNIKYHRVNLDGQWRSGGSAVYDEWVRGLLNLGAADSQWDGDSEARPWPGDEHFEVRLADSPAQMEEFLRARMVEGSTARITAGYCWPWSDPNDDKSLVDDVVIGDWARPWNANGDGVRVGKAPTSQFWATLPGGFDQIGCIYTAQGLEFDWAGVIVGPDLIARGGGLRTVREANRDSDLVKRSVSDEQFDRLIRNTYKVLLTRGLKGVVIYACDDQTREHLRALVPPVTS
ncbi:DUF2075 domain-containing protein [Herbidospora yilanensis]|uniref:DUF2075 domain-containing protein n=1 Tax=Herbidospora yilanensis TaxID=354426 RepID=UPI00078333F4|nr:DUF2075 domain-containing protein [Herbidospora yilanensis]